VLGTLEWCGTGDAGSRLVTVSSRDGSTTVGGTADLKQLAVVAYVTGGIISFLAAVLGFAAATQEGSMLGMGLSLAVIPVAFTGLRAIVRRVAAAQARKLEATVDAVARAIEER
jgi:hypothetical protein